MVLVELVGGRGGMGKTRPLGEVPHLDAAAVEARALALVEVERRPAGDGRAVEVAPMGKCVAASAEERRTCWKKPSTSTRKQLLEAKSPAATGLSTTVILVQLESYAALLHL